MDFQVAYGLHVQLTQHASDRSSLHNKTFVPGNKTELISVYSTLFCVGRTIVLSGAVACYYPLTFDDGLIDPANHQMLN